MQTAFPITRRLRRRVSADVKCPSPEWAECPTGLTPPERSPDARAVCIGSNPSLRPILSRIGRKHRLRPGLGVSHQNRGCSCWVRPDQPGTRVAFSLLDRDDAPANRPSGLKTPTSCSSPVFRRRGLPTGPSAGPADLPPGTASPHPIIQTIPHPRPQRRPRWAFAAPARAPGVDARLPRAWANRGRFVRGLRPARMLSGPASGPAPPSPRPPAERDGS